MDAVTLDAFRRRDANAVRAVYQRYGALVYSVALGSLGRRDLAEEAVQQTFISAWRAAERIDVDRDPAPWLVTIAKREAIDIYRRETRRPTTPLTEATVRERELVALPAETLDAVWQVRQAIDALSTEDAAIVRLQHLDGLSHREISDQLGIALGTVKSRSHRAHRALTDLLRHLRGPAHD